MSVLQITSREFRERQASYFDLADSGEQIIIKRGSKQSYTLVPVEDSDLSISAELRKSIKRAREEYKNGNVVICNTHEEILKHLESL